MTVGMLYFAFVSRIMLTCNGQIEVVFFASLVKSVHYFSECILQALFQLNLCRSFCCVEIRFITIFFCNFSLVEYGKSNSFPPLKDIPRKNLLKCVQSSQFSVDTNTQILEVMHSSSVDTIWTFGAQIFEIVFGKSHFCLQHQLQVVLLEG